MQHKIKLLVMKEKKKDRKETCTGSEILCFLAPVMVCFSGSLQQLVNAHVPELVDSYERTDLASGDQVR